jgi:hypothetical protein
VEGLLALPPGEHAAIRFRPLRDVEVEGILEVTTEGLAEALEALETSEVCPAN